MWLLTREERERRGYIFIYYSFEWWAVILVSCYTVLGGFATKSYVNGELIPKDVACRFFLYFDLDSISASRPLIPPSAPPVILSHVRVIDISGINLLMTSTRDNSSHLTRTNFSVPLRSYILVLTYVLSCLILPPLSLFSLSSPAPELSIYLSI